MIADGFAWVGTVLIVGLNLPQVWRTCVRGLTAGVPAARAWVAIAVAMVWLGYGLSAGIAVQVVLNAIVLVLNGALLVRLAPTASVRTNLRWAALVVTTGAITIGLHRAGGSLAVGTAGAVAGSGLCLPQLMALRGAGAVDGISLSSLWLQAAGGLCWLIYGLLRLETVVWVPNVFVLATTAATLALLLRSTPGGLTPTSTLARVSVRHDCAAPARHHA